MANYTIDRITYGGNTYILKDSSASTTDNKVSLTADSSNSSLPITFKKGTTSPAGIYYNNNITINPSTGTINATAAKFVNLGADKGVFNKLIATSADINTLDVNNLTADNATVVGMLDVQGELHTNAWTNANIANIGGSFYITPTVEAVSGTISITRVSATSWTVAATGSFATNFIKSGTNTSGVAWPANSLVLITGNVTIGNLVYPLGTLKGTLSSAVTASAASTSKTITITGVTDAQNNATPAVLQELYELNGNANISGATFSNGKISLYKLGSYPIGIQMSSMGTNANSLIEIYGGVSTNPSVRIGHLAGAPAVNETSPTGWGIYTDNGYFSGVIVSSSGKIGNWSITDSSIQTGTFDTANTMYFGSSGISLGNTFKVTNAGVLTAKSGTIGGYTIDSTSLYSGTKGNSTTSGHFTLTTDTFTRSIDGTSRSNLQIALGSKFGVANDGTLYANGANITNINANNISTNLLSAIQAKVSTLSAITADMGTLTAGTISYGTTGNNNSFYLSANGSKTATIAGASRSNLRLTVGSGFGVDYNGKLYATGADINGAINATSLTIASNATITDPSGLINNEDVEEYTDDVTSTLSESLSEKISQTSSELSDKIDEVRTLANSKADSSALNNLSLQMQEYIGEGGYIYANNGTLIIATGQNIGNFKIGLTGQQIVFYENDIAVAYIEGKKMYITRSEVTDEQKISNFAFKKRDDGRFTLMYVGG